MVIKNKLTALKGEADIDTEMRSPNINPAALFLNNPNFNIPGSQNFNIEFEIKAGNEIRFMKRNYINLKT